ncbi:MAG: hemolysin family protein [Pseudomonadota bacterium]
MIELAALLLLLILSGVFSGSETALVSLSIGRVEGLVREGRHGAEALYRLKQDPSRMLTTILIGNNLVNIAASVLATVVATRWLGAAGPGVAVGVLTILVLVFGEITPKSLATRYSERISLFIAPVLLGFMHLIYPVVWIFGRFTSWIHQLSSHTGDPTVTESEFISMLEHGEQEGTIEPSERELIERVFAFNDLKVRDVMTPHTAIFALEAGQTVREGLPAILQAQYSRIPLYEQHRDRLYKVLHLRDLLEALAANRLDIPLRELARDPLFVPQYQPIDELFAEFQRSKRMFAIVVDEYGVVRGLVTQEDLLEELVGEIYDESDVTEPEVTGISADELVVAGTTELRVVEEYFGLDLPGKPTDTVNLWILTHTECIPRKDEQFDIDGLDVRIRAATPRRIEQVRIRRSAETSAEAAAPA